MLCLLLQDAVPVSSHLFSSMFAACAAAGTPDMLEAAERSHMDMEGLWNKICSKGKTPAEERQVPQAALVASGRICRAVFGALACLFWAVRGVAPKMILLDWNPD